MIEGLSHITFVVRDPDRTATLLEKVFDALPIYDSGDKPHSLSRERFFLIANVWIAIMEGEPLPAKSYNHVAFKIAEEDFDLYESRIRSLGLESRTARPRIRGEGRSLYFHDYDNHLFELHTGTLSDRMMAYRDADG